MINTYNPDNLSEIQLWGLALAGPLTDMNGLRHDVLHHHGNTDRDIDNLKHMMKRDWGISTREEYLDMLEFLSTRGHNHSYMQIQDHLNSLSENAIDSYIGTFSHDVDKSNELKLVRNYRHSLNSCGIKAWDDGRYVSICRWGATVGVFSEQECWEKIYQLSLIAQKTYDSWYEYMLSYTAGRQYWQSDISESKAKVSISTIKNLTSTPQSPCNILSWRLNLKKRETSMLERLLLAVTR